MRGNDRSNQRFLRMEGTVKLVTRKAASFSDMMQIFDVGDICFGFRFRHFGPFRRIDVEFSWP